MVNQLSSYNVCGVNIRICLKIYLSIIGLLLLLIIIDICLPDWLHQGIGKQQWHGNLTQVFEGSELVSQDKFDEIGDNFCDESQDWWLQQSQQEAYKALCERFRTLHAAGRILIIGTVTCIICFVIVIISLILTLTKYNCKILTVVFNFVGASVYTIVAFIYLQTSHAHSENDCDQIYDKEQRDDGSWDIQIYPACRDSGGDYLLLLAYVVPFVSIFLIVGGCCCLQIDMNKIAIQNQTQPVQGIGNVQQTRYHQVGNVMQVCGSSNMQTEYPSQIETYPQPVIRQQTPQNYPPQIERNPQPVMVESAPLNYLPVLAKHETNAIMDTEHGIQMQFVQFGTPLQDESLEENHYNKD